MILARPLTAGMRGVDCITPIDGAHATAMRANGVDFVMRYLPFANQTIGPSMISRAEYEDILSAPGLALGAVQHVRRHWTPDAGIGAADGLAAVRHARLVGFAPGTTLFYDMEGPEGGSVADYDRAWSDVVGSCGFGPGGYFGFGVDLTPDQLWMLHVTQYWKSGSSVAEPAHCGWSMVQELPFNQNESGIQVDRNRAIGDKLGRFPVLMVGDDGSAA